MIIIKINQKRIVNPKRYLFELHYGDEFYVVAPLSEKDLQRLLLYGIVQDGIVRIPIPRKSATEANANGKWIPRRNLPKEVRVYWQAYHILDWHGNDHYGTCARHRLCYQREFVSATNLAFVVEEGVLYSPLLENKEECMHIVKAVINIVLEMIGHCEIWTKEKKPVVSNIKEIGVPWEILRSGTRNQELVSSHIEKILTEKSKAIQIEIWRRHEYLRSLKPEFYVLGSQNFFGYIVYGFERYNLFIFESNEINNATYVFCRDWKQVSRLTKMEVLYGDLQEARVYHTANWEMNINQIFSKFSAGVA